MKFSFPHQSTLIATAIALNCASLQAQQRDIVEEVREASEPMEEVEKKLHPPEPFIQTQPTEDPQVAAYLDPAWNWAQLYFDERNEVLQEVALTGILQLRATRSDLSGRKGDVDDTRRVANRRARLGARIKAFYNTTLEADAEFVGNEYRRINDFKIRNHFNTNLWLSLGKMKAPFSNEWTMHSADMKTPERSPLVNQLHPRRSPGFMIDGRYHDTWKYQVGIFSGEDDREFGGLNNPFLMVGIGYDFARETIPKLDSTAPPEDLPERLKHREEWYLHYIHNFAPEDSTVIGGSRAGSNAISANTGNPIGSEQQYRHLLATGFNFDQEYFSLNAEMLWAKGDNSAVWGASITPSYWIKPGEIEIVGRYAYAASDSDEGLLLNSDPTRDFLYTNSQIFTGNQIHSFYLGGNYYPYASKFNVQTGVDYTLLDSEAGDIESWSYFIGTRLKF